MPEDATLPGPPPPGVGPIEPINEWGPLEIVVKLFDPRVEATGATLGAAEPDPDKTLEILELASFLPRRPRRWSLRKIPFFFCVYMS
ncbi:JM134 [macacine gammaherpesvirus 11]|uniref:JM134 n=2 Tax=macacine gammaherpesvirus 11 TaxID=2560570 RepID=G9JME2_9GAMA|nr:JM134 [Macaca fuscata rhadinovirus]AAT00111.1 JM134 [Macaca fuscata rhadinovirus]AEW87659.1 JM134 [Macaca fuscata rhadinovirus]AEW87829.1 JM134 [Macaca fuscata rhadinovirus]